MRTVAPDATAASNSWGDVMSLTLAILLDADALRYYFQCQHGVITTLRSTMLVGTCAPEPSGVAPVASTCNGPSTLLANREAKYS